MKLTWMWFRDVAWGYDNVAMEFSHPVFRLLFPKTIKWNNKSKNLPQKYHFYVQLNFAVIQLSPALTSSIFFFTIYNQFLTR